MSKTEDYCFEFGISDLLGNEMGQIRVLQKEVVEKIAAGEVVERPASVIKELVENAIDAGAASVSVGLTAGGLEGIRVRDDGRGMDAADLALCVKPHATSKIASARDLWRIGTMGFRGEALASIASISRLEIVSRPADADVECGARLAVEGGSEPRVTPAGCAQGTEVAVRDLFYNVPARKKFMKSERVEAARCVEAVEELALAYPQLRFELDVDGARRLSLAACPGDRTERASAILKAHQLIPVAGEAGEISLAGWVSERGRRGGRDVHVFVNGRPVKDRMMMHAIAASFGERLDAGAHPAAALWLAIDPSKVDVNVHPAKREVRFAEPAAVHSFLTSALKRALGGSEVMLREGRAETVPNRAGLPSDPGPTPRSASSVSSSMPQERCGAAGELPFERGAVPTMRPLGQFGGAFIACEGDDGSLTIIDKHAAHERMGFDELMGQHRRGNVARQRLLIPEQVELREADAASLVENSKLLAEAGFEVEPFGGGTIVLKEVPAIAGAASAGALMGELAREICEMGHGAALDEAIERIFAVVACHRQVRAGDELRPEEVARLVRDVEAKGVKTCPHGRPAVIRVERDEIEKWFGRK